jgi:hypothetical protein
MGYNTLFWKLDLLPSSGEGETPTLLCPLEGGNLNHWATHVNIAIATYTPETRLCQKEIRIVAK